MAINSLLIQTPQNDLSLYSQSKLMHKTLGQFLFLLLTLCGQQAFAQTSLVSSPYTQNFNTLAATSTSSVMPTGWSFVEAGTSADASYSVNSGTSSSGNTYSCGSASATDRALGSLGSSTLDSVTFGCKFTNNSGGVINNPTLSFTSEQWRCGGNTNIQNYAFAYSTSAGSSLISGTWISATSGNMVSIINNSSALALDGNAPANKSVITLTLSGVSIPVGGTFGIRWRDRNDVGSDHVLAIDDLSLSWSACTPIITPTLSASATTVCNVVGSTTLSVLPQAGVSFAFSGPGSITSLSSTSASVIAIPAGSQTYTVVATNACGATISTNTVITSTPTATPAFDILGIVCVGSTVAPLPTTSLNGISGTWSPSTINSSVVGVSTYTFTPSAGACASVYTHTIIVEALPTVSVSASSPSFSCEVTSITLTATTNTMTYGWNTGNSSLTINVSTVGAYTFTAISAAACLQTATIAITDNTVLTTWYADTDADGYYGTGAATVAACSTPTGYVAVTKSGDCAPTNAAVNPSIAEICNGLDDNCDGVSEINATCVPVVVVPNVVVLGTKATFKWNASCYQSFRVQYRQTTPAGLTWTLKNVNSPAATQTAISGLAPGTYQWRVRGKCWSTGLFSALNTGSVNFTIAAALMADENPLPPTLVAYPNPASDLLLLRVPTEGGLVQLVNAEGRVVFRTIAEELEISIPISALSTGLYSLQYLGAETLSQQVLIKR
jgi:Putative metal-binding motif